MKRVLLVSLLLVVGCSSQTRKVRSTPTASYQDAVNEYLSQKNEKALQSINEFLSTRPHSTRYKEAMYLKGKILKRLSRTEECVSNFMNVIDLSKGVKDSYFVYSLYYKGICHEMMGDVASAIASYQDALKVKSAPRDLKELELPARLAVAYSRLGESLVSRKYYDKTKKELGMIRKARGLSEERKKDLSQVLFDMGTLTYKFSSNKDFQNYLNSIRLAQEYLILVLRLDNGVQSESATELILQNFEGVKNHIDNLPIENLEDAVLAKRQRQENRQELSKVLIESIESFENVIVPEVQAKVPFAIEVMKKTNQIKLELKKIIAERPVGEGLTPEAQKIQNIKVPVIIKDKKTSLENE